MTTNFQAYEQAMSGARAHFDRGAGPHFLLSCGPESLERFLIHFCAIGVRMTEPVEGWLVRAGERCEAASMPDLGRALRHHSKAESGHHLMMIADVRALTARWNARRSPPFDAEILLECQPSPGARRYCRLHDDNIAGPTPYAQIAIEYEIEQLPVRLGPRVIGRCVEVLGHDILKCLSFLTEHIELDVGHTRFNAHHLEKVLDDDPGRLPMLVAAGTAALESYAQFLADCADLARSASPKGVA